MVFGNLTWWYLDDILDLGFIIEWVKTFGNFGMGECILHVEMAWILRH